MKFLFVSACLLAVAFAQKKGQQTPESPIDFTIEKCSGSGNCQSESGAVVLDSNWRWTHKADDYVNCYTGNEWDTSICPDVDTCTTNCAIDGVSSSDWSGTYGINGGGNQVSLKFKTEGQYSTNIGSRVFLLDSSKSKYHMFQLMNKEFTFTADSSQLDCGLNGALYLVEMFADGGLSEFSTNEAGAAYGTGYCDAQCPHDMKWINGEANVDDWTPSADDPNSGFGRYGTCCAEMDLWEANSKSQAYTSHPCNLDGPQRCDGNECGDNDKDRYGGVCDKDGCDFASYRMGDKDYFGAGKTVDSGKPITVVTQFLSDDGTENGNLKEIRRLYVQDGNVIENSKVNVPGVSDYDSITDQMCADVKSAFGDVNDHDKKGGLKKMGEALKRGMVLTMSLWDDHDAHMLWLDSDYPTDQDPSKPGISRGPCPTSSGVPSEVENSQPDATVKFSNIKYGDIGSTY